MAYRRSALMEERLAENRQRIISAARTLVAKGGFRAASIAQVAGEAGLSTGSIYRYFPSKSDLFVEVLNQAANLEIKVLKEAASSGRTATDSLYAAVEAFARRAFDGPFLAYAFIVEPTEPEVDAARIKVRRAFSRVFKTVIERGIANGELPEQDADISAGCIVGAFTEALAGPIRPTAKGARRREQVIESICCFCARAVQAPQA